MIKKNGSWDDITPEYVLNRAKKWSFLYATWMLIYAPLSIYGLRIQGFSLVNGIAFVVRGILFVGETYYNWPLWTLMTMIYGTLFLWLIKRKGKSCTFLAGCIVGVIILGTCVSTFVEMGSFGQLSTFLLTVIPSPNRLWIGFVYMGIGALIAEYLDKKDTRWLILAGISFVIIRLIVWQCTLESLQTVLNIFSNSAFFILVTQIEIPNWKGYLLLRKTSTVTYYTHMIFFTVIGILFFGNPTPYGGGSFLATIAMTFMLSFLIYYLEKQKQMGWLKRIF